MERRYDGLHNWVTLGGWPVSAERGQVGTASRIDFDPEPDELEAATETTIRWPPGYDTSRRVRILQTPPAIDIIRNLRVFQSFSDNRVDRSLEG